MAEVKKRNNVWIWILAAALVFLLFVVFLVTALIALIGGSGSFKPFGPGSVGVVRISGVISGDGQQASILGVETGTSPEVFRENIRDALEDSSVKAILIRVNSPGGTPAASQEIYHEVARASRKKPVIASISDVGASGAYYGVCPSKKIFADASSLVGSIGVYMEIPVLKGLYDKLGIDYTIIKSGKYKALGHPDRDLTSQEKEILQKQIDEMYSQFIGDVAKARKNLTVAQVKKIGNGLAYPGSEAKRLGLIDAIGTYGTALDDAAKAGGLEGDYDVKEFSRRGFGILDFFEALLNLRLAENPVKIR